MTEALAIFQRAAKQGCVEGQVGLGVNYELGFGVRKDSGKAAEYYQQAANKGDAFAQSALGEADEKGEGVPKDLDKARELYQKAADQGNKNGIADLKELQGR